MNVGSLPLNPSLWISFKMSYIHVVLCLTVSLSLSHRYPGSGVVLDCIDS